MAAKRRLTQRILRWLLAYAVAVSALVAAGGYIIHERVERLAWDSVLRAELGDFQQDRLASPGYRWRDTETLRLFGAPGTPALPSALAALPGGLHDDQTVNGVHSVVLRANLDGTPVAMALDLSGFDSAEGAITAAVAGGTVVLILLLGLGVMWRLGREVAPLSELARQVGQLEPGEQTQHVALSPRAGIELSVIAAAFNGFLDRTQAYVQRERAFIATTSHELRTPVAVIGGAADLLLAQPDLLPTARMQAARIARMAAEVEQLISLLLMLARDPARLASISEAIALEQLLPQIVEDHRHLLGAKALALQLEPPQRCEIQAPPGVVQAALGNLLRNAIEHSDSGEIRVRLMPDATVVIEDPGHGMTPEQVSEIYGRLARGDGTADSVGSGIGIGIDLLSRLCDHFGWRLQFDSTPDSGTTTTLRFRRPDEAPLPHAR